MLMCVVCLVLLSSSLFGNHKQFPFSARLIDIITDFLFEKMSNISVAVVMYHNDYINGIGTVPYVQLQYNDTNENCCGK